MKKEGIMRINSYNKFFAEVAKIMNTSVKAVKQLDGRYKVELANHVYLNVYRGICGSLFIHDHRCIAHITSCYDFEDFKTMNDLYERLVIDYSEADTVHSEEPEETNATEEKNSEVRYECNARFGKDQYFDTDSVQPNKKIIAKIENIHCCPNRNTCCFVTPYANCDYNYKSDICIKAYNYFIHVCEQMHRQMKARSNPEWHHVNLETLANIDIDMLDEKRQRYFKIYKELIKTVNDLHKCKTAATYATRWLRFKQVIADDIYYRGTTLYMTRFLDLKISMCNVECGLWSSADEKATSFIKSRRYRHTTLK